MLTSILSAICALSLGVSELSIQTDTVNVYIIDGKKVENFDGSQLVGKTISSYNIGKAENSKNGPIKIHIIKTDDPNAKKIAVQDNGDNKASSEPEVFVDGKKLSSVEFAKIKPEDIASVTIFKAGSKDALKWTKSKDKSAMVVELKKR